MDDETAQGQTPAPDKRDKIVRKVKDAEVESKVAAAGAVPGDQPADSVPAASTDAPPAEVPPVEAPPAEAPPAENPPAELPPAPPAQDQLGAPADPPQAASEKPKVDKAPKNKKPPEPDKPVAVRCLEDFRMMLNGSLVQFHRGQVVGSYSKVQELLSKKAKVVIVSDDEYSICENCRHIQKRG